VEVGTISWPLLDIKTFLPLQSSGTRSNKFPDTKGVSPKASRAGNGEDLRKGEEVATF
jgi:hypothetical protein